MRHKLIISGIMMLIILLTGIVYAQQIETGYLSVTIEPSEAIIAGAAWRPSVPGNGEDFWAKSGDIVSGLDAGFVQIEFKPIPRWISPSAKDVEIKPNQKVVETGIYLPETGSVSVTIEPSEVKLNGKWSIYREGIGWSEGFETGKTVSGIRTGATSIKFLPIEGWLEPPEKSIEVKAGVITNETGEYKMRTGSIQVNITPEEARNAGAQWRIDGGVVWFDGGYVLPNIQTGNYKIVFKPMEGWEKPDDKLITIVENQMVITIGIYRELKGSLQVTILPAAAVQAGAKWKVDGGVWHVSDDVVSNLTVGSHKVEYLAIADWNKPPDANVTIEPNKTIIQTAAYTQQVKAPIIRIEPASMSFEQNEIKPSELPDGAWVPLSPAAANLPQASPEVQKIESSTDILKARLITQGMFVEHQVENNKDYQIIHLGPYNGNLPPGSPNLPEIRRYIYIPQGKIANVQVITANPIEFTDYLIYPMQKAQPDAGNPEENGFYINEADYNEDRWIPEQNAMLGNPEIIRGHGVSLLKICPFQYNPAKKILRVYQTVDVQVGFNGKQIDLLENRLGSPVFERLVRGMVFNPESFVPYPINQNNGVNSEGAQYLIITAPEFMAQATALCNHKIARGIDTVVKTTLETGASKARIKDYIKNAYVTWSPAPSYVLLLGDVEKIPTTYEISEERGTDLYYATVDGDDYIPDIFIGRIPVNTVSEAETVIQKIIQYESHPPVSPPFYATAAIASYFQDDNNDGYEDRQFIKTSEEIRKFLLSKAYQVKRIYSTNSSNPKHYNNGIYGKGDALPEDLLMSNGFKWAGNASDISSAIQSGVFLLIHRDHGMDRNAGNPHTGWVEPEFVETNVSELTNGSLLPVVMSIDCQTGWFDGNFDSFSELMLQQPNGGAVGVFGAARDSTSGYNDALLSGLIDGVWADFLPEIPNNMGAISQLGPMLTHGKLVMDQLWGDPMDKRREQYELFHIFGDPTLELWTFDPNGRQKSFTIYNDGNAELTVTSMTKQANAAWLDFTPKAPFRIQPGQSRVVSVTIDWSKTKIGNNEERIVVESTDIQHSPYPNAVMVTARTLPQQHTLTLSKKGNGKILLNGKLHELPIELKIDENQIVSVEAAPDNDWLFENWVIDGKIFTERGTDIKMDKDKSAAVNFICPLKTYSLTILKEGKGAVKVDGTLYGFPFVHSFKEGTSVSLEASPSEDFISWSGDLEGNRNPQSIQMNSDKTVTVVFKEPAYTGWQTVITSQGQILDGMDYDQWVDAGEPDKPVNQVKVKIGVDKTACTEPSLLPSKYSVSAQLYTDDWKGGPFSKDIREEGSETYTWVIAINPHGNIMPPDSRTSIMSWDASTFSPAGFYQLKKKNADNSIDIVIPDMRIIENYKVTGTDAVQYFILEFGPKTTVEINLNAGWNLISLPVTPDNSKLKAIFPDAIVAYKFENNMYSDPVKDITPGFGYWITVPSDRTYRITGENISEYSKTLTKGWHLLGAVNGAAKPECGSIEVIYGFDEFYSEVKEFAAGKGYWVYLRDKCEVVVKAR